MPSESHWAYQDLLSAILIQVLVSMPTYREEQQS